MPIIKDGTPIEDQWVEHLGEDDVPSSEDVILSLELADRMAERLSNHAGGLGLSIPNDIDVEDYKELIATADLIILQLPVFTDGRAYSQARILREDLGFDNELRVKGDVLPDQAAYLIRCGFDSFDFEGSFDQDVWDRAVSIIGTSYQRNYRNKMMYKSV